MIDLYGSGSPNVVKVFFMLGETELPFRIEYVNVMAGENFDPAFVALNPNAKIPLIVDHDGPDGRPLTVFESGAILVYLAEKTGRFHGRSLAERMTVLQWVMLQMSSIGPTFGQAVHFKGVAPEGNDYALTRYFSEAVRLCGVLDRRLSESEYLGGPEFSIADMATFPWLWKYPKQLGIDLSGLPNLERWRAAMEARPGFERIRGTIRELVQRGLVEQQNAPAEVLDRFYRRGRWAASPERASQP
jgi:GST-like protein